ncbi:MAG: GAF domain-containing protein [Acidobacteria bacterium]|nr:GAF domain-containing protein [Acidobacteriota bacterium]
MTSEDFFRSAVAWLDWQHPIAHPAWSWSISRRASSMVMEYISPGIKSSDGASLGRLVMGIQQTIAGKNFPMVAENASESPMLVGLQEALKLLGVESLVAVALRDGEQDIGILVVQECGKRRTFRGNDLAALEAISEQIVMAVANVRLRNLMKALAVTDERSGLLARDSYLTCLASEAERMRTQKSPLTVGLLQFVAVAQANGGKKSEGSRKAEDPTLDDFIQRFSCNVMQQLRQNDIALKYSSRVLALVLPGATTKDSAPVMEKMRRLAINTASGTGTAPPEIIAGFAEAIREGTMDNVDRVTELINRLEWALDDAVKEGGSNVKIVSPPLTP